MHKDFRLEQLQDLIDYLHRLGITTIYGSPITTAAPGSLHGYDVSDPHTINPEIGSLNEFRKIGERLKEKGMTWLQDIVPNHMSFTHHNFRLMDVLERGTYSEYNRFFDIDLLHPATDLNGKLIVPFLGADLQSCIDNGEIKLSFSEQGFTIDVYESRYPLSVSTYPYLAAQTEDGNLHNTIKSLAEKCNGLTYKEWAALKKEWISQNNSFSQKINETVARINNDKEKLKFLLQQQHYTLSHWQRTMQEINYRRFFIVNSLICVAIEDEQVFEEYHRFLHELFREGLIHGLRIDHIDGLQDPDTYIGRLRNKFGEDCYIIAEKILEAAEKIPGNWNMEGTSGYEFLAQINRLLTSKRGTVELKKIYQSILPDTPAYEDIVTRRKKRILENFMQGEWENLARYFFELRLQQDFDRDKLKQAIGAIMIAMPVYRVYPHHFPLPQETTQVLDKAFLKAHQLQPDCKSELDYLQQLFNGNAATEELQNHTLHFMKRLMQFTGPIMAKGVEDTTFYVYNPLISHNEVGDDPSLPAITVGDFHQIMKERLKHTPFSLNATSTHDTKRGEDARMRINVLGEFPGEWEQKVKEWFEINRNLHQTFDGNEAPAVNDEYFIYQSIIGAFPDNADFNSEWIGRLQAYMVKAVREAKENSNWETPNATYENACSEFIGKLFDPQHHFLQSLIPFAKKVLQHASIYSLAQTVIKITAPGIPDIYQGCELWDLSFVDPDNRRPIDYTHRKEILSQIIEKEKEGNKALIGFVKDRWQEGYEKMFVTWKLLQYRKNNPTLFLQGEYIPIDISGKEVEAIAFARRHEGRQVVIVVPLGIGNRFINRNTLIKKWNGSLELPVSVPGKWRNIFTGESFISGGQLALQDIFQIFPIAVLEMV